MKIDFRADIREVTKALDAVGSAQVPFATAYALTLAASKAKEAVRKAMPTVFDRPTPATLDSMRVVMARKDRLFAEVLIKDENPKGTAPEKYLKAEIEGGPRAAKRSERALQATGKLPNRWAWVPGDAAPIDGYGNLRGGFITKILSEVGGLRDPYQNATDRSRKRKRISGRQVSYFVGAPGGGRLPLGIWARYRFAWGSAIKPILIFVHRRPTYNKKLLFYDIVRQVAERELPAAFQEALSKALATARPSAS